MASPADAAGPGLGTIIQLGFGLADSLNRLIGGGLSKREREALTAARAAGYERDRRGWTTPDGQRTTERAVLQAGAAILGATQAPPAPPPTIPGTEPRPLPEPQPQPSRGRRPDWRDNPREGKRVNRRPEVKRPPARGYDPRAQLPERVPNFPRANPPIINPNLPYYEPARSVPLWARVLGGIGLLLYPTPTASNDTIPGPMPGQPTGPARRPRIRVPGTPAQDVWGPAPVGTPVIVTAPRPRPPVLTSPLPANLPTPTAWPTPVPVPAPTPTSSPAPPSFSWPQLLLLPLPLFSSSPRPAAPSPLTPPRPGTSVQPQPGSAFRPPVAPPLTPVQTGPLGFTQPIPSQDPCANRRPQDDRKRKRKRKPRTVCYSGTFQERRNGLTKQRRRKIPCR
jgi:hypothetical protein